MRGILKPMHGTQNRCKTENKNTCFSVLSTIFAVVLFLVEGMGVLPAHGAIELNITQGQVQPIPIALPAFSGRTGDDQQLGADVTAIIASNLERSGLFAPIPEQAYLERLEGFAKAPNFQSWRAINAQALVVGEVVAEGGDRLRADFRLFDVYSQKQIVGLQFSTSLKNWRRLGHLISDAIYTALTGEEGYFDTRVVFVDEKGPKNKRTKRLMIMDQDGFNVRPLTQDSSLVLTPRFNPVAQEITYVAYENNQPHVYLYNIATGNHREVRAFDNESTIAPRFSQDGRSLILSVLRGGASHIYTLDLETGGLRQLTRSSAIDTSPSFAPDGQAIVFESDRGGSQQIYIMNADGSNQRRISFGEGRYSTPVWSPRGDLIAFTKMVRGRFAIGVMKPDGTGERILTEGFHNEGPTWAPNGRVLMFFRDVPGEQGGARLYSVDVTGYNERPIKTPGFASDPAWSPLLK